MRTLSIICLLASTSVAFAARAPRTVNNPAVPNDGVRIVYEDELKLDGTLTSGWVKKSEPYNFFSIDSVVSNGSTIGFEVDRTAGKLDPVFSLFDGIVRDGQHVGALGDVVFSESNPGNVEPLSFSWTADRDYDGLTAVVGNKNPVGKSDFYLTGEISAPDPSAVPEPSSVLVWITLGLVTVGYSKFRKSSAAQK